MEYTIPMEQHSQNTKWFVTIIILLLIIIAGLIIVVMRNQKNPTEYTPQVENTTQNSLTTSSKFNLKYPGNEMTVVEDYYLTPGQMGNGASENTGEARATFTAINGNLVINWGGPQAFCMPDGGEDEFIPGVSLRACVKGRIAYVGVKDVRATLSQADKDLFAQFVASN